MTNRLHHSTSPYLQQHADNPVDWYEWGEEALTLAKRSDKPILLSIGYSACHWCHVMAHESFEDPRTAALMNEHFINIKVDREERPDIDQIYQSAHAMLSGSGGGWPLTLFLTPDTVPFFTGTYFPREAKYGLPGFATLLPKVAQYYREHREAVEQQTQALAAALQQGRQQPPAHEPQTRQPMDEAFSQITELFDTTYGGFGQAPKFPHIEMIEFSLRRFAESGDSHARHMACHTLERQCQGGIYDQIGGGFARYSVDREWAIPHFEKMLYDNGSWLRILSDAWLVAENEEQKNLFARCATDTAAWVMHDMQSSAGGYYASRDADSEGHEGRFYVWARDEVKALLTADEWRVVELHYGLDRPANFEGESWHLVVSQPVVSVAKTLGLAEEQAALLLAAARQKLSAQRERRIHPGRDEKILTAWNALMIEGMARAAQVFGRADWLASARRALTFAQRTLWDAERQRLRATHKDGKTRLNAYLDDYAYLLKATLEMMQADFQPHDLEFACQLAEVLLTQFEDAEQGGFYFTSHDHEQLIQRPKPGFDNAIPSGNGVAAWALQRMTHLTGDDRYAAAAARTLRHFAGFIAAHPGSYSNLLMAWGENLEPTGTLILRGPAAALKDWQRQLTAWYLPTTVLLCLADDVSTLPAVLNKPAPTDGTVNAYLCQGVHCLPPMTSMGQLQTALKPPIVPDLQGDAVIRR